MGDLPAERRACCYTIGVVKNASVLEARTAWEGKEVKDITILPITQEWELALGFYGEVFNQTFLEYISRDGGINFRTFPSVPDKRATSKCCNILLVATDIDNIYHSFLSCSQNQSSWCCRQ